MIKKYPSISVVIPAHNEEKNLRILFGSLKNQKYPKSKIEYILIDDGSIDKTSELGRKFGAKVYKVNTKDIELNKGIGLRKSRNDYVYFLDADMEICDDRFWEKLIIPFLDNSNIIGSFTKEFSFKGSNRKVNSLLRFISYDPLQRDPLYKFISVSLEKTFVSKINDYYLCEFTPSRIPTVGRIMYKKSKLMKTEIAVMDQFIDMESVEIMARRFNGLFAYVPDAKIRHYHIDTLFKMVKKRLRNLERDYLPNLEHKYFIWFNPKKRGDVLKIIFWVIYANLFLPELVRGIIRSIIHMDIAFMWHPIVSITTTDAIIYGFLRQPKGRKLAVNLINGLFNKN